MSPKNFQDLINEVHNKGICQECGGCVSFCSSAEYDIIALKDPYSPPVYINKDQCLECGICYHICPQTHVMDDELFKTFQFKGFSSMPIGNYINIYSCQATDPKFLKYGTDGGVVNSIINYLIEKKLIDGSIVSRTDAPFSREAAFVDSKSGLIKTSGTKLEVSPQLSEIQKFCTYTDSIQKLNHYKFKKLAIVGTPCQLYTIRCMQDLGVTPSQNIEICLGLFCFENFLFDRMQIDKFEKDFNIKLENIKKINIKEDLILKLKDNSAGERLVHIPFSHLDDYIRPACNACDDFTNILSDISFGGLGSPDKFTTVIPRTEKGIKLFNKVQDEGIIKCLELDSAKKLHMKELIIHMSQQKIKRKEDFIKKLT
ncbi:MAG: Coenzyme F420 hydrogenase/dehydrogenase, beta subunit C-terminal domain [Promethearchaeota archaeon]|nr:MAG: Coenzyme F420 hydrogenase/dehydrogenase, beta subunit C-terminal domain [Candidatus Lokiarchaeota archaeon]